MRRMELTSLPFLLVATCFLLVIVEGQATTECNNLATTECNNLANSANCFFYTECVERNMPCGPSGYAVGYGYHFCNAFGELSGEFTPKVYNYLSVCL